MARFPLYVPLIGRDNLTPTLQKATSGISRFGGKLNSIGRGLTAGITLPTIAAGAAIFRTGAKFELEMNRVRALSGATGNDLKQLRDQAKELGRTTVHSATDAAGAQALLAQAGFKTHQNLATLPSVMNLASAASIELSDSTSILSDVMKGYNITADESSRVADVLTATQASANTTVLELGEAFKQAGPLAAGAGIDFEETAAFLAVLADKGFKASMSGTAVRSMLNKLGKPSAEAKRALAELGIQRDSILNADGTVKSWKALIEEFSKAEASIPQLNTIFGERAVGPFQAVLTAGASELDAKRKLIDDSTGLAERQAKQILEGPAGSLARFRSALEGFSLQIADSGFLNHVAAGIQVVTDFVSKLAATDPELIRIGTSIVLVAAVAGPLFGILGTGVTVVGGLIGGLSKLITVTKIGFALFRAHPIGMLVTAGVALAAVAVQIWKNWDSTMGFWGNVGAFFKDFASNILGKLLSALKRVAEWVLPDWAMELLGIGDAKPKPKSESSLPEGGGPEAIGSSAAGGSIVSGTPGPGGAGGQASVALTIKSDRPGVYSVDGFDAGGTDLTIDQGVALGAVTG